MTKENLATFLAQLTEAESQLKTPTFENLFNNVRYQTSNVQRSFEQFFDTLKTGTENNTIISKLFIMD
jgi:endonuclease IV